METPKHEKHPKQPQLHPLKLTLRGPVLDIKSDGERSARKLDHCWMEPKAKQMDGDPLGQNDVVINTPTITTNNDPRYRASGMYCSSKIVERRDCGEMVFHRTRGGSF